MTVEQKRDLLAAGYNGGHDKLGRKMKWNIDKMPKETIEHVAKINAAMTQFHQEELFRNIAYYRGKIERYESTQNIFWLAMNTLP